MIFFEDFTSGQLPDGFYWFNEPAKQRLDNGLELVTKAETDFWQNTHYGFQRDDGHCLFTKLSGDFSFATQASFAPVSQYDQCGLMLRVDAHNWIKMGVEFENPQISRLGSVVTNLGYSDWATQDISSTHTEMKYRISRCGDDFLLESAFAEAKWAQMRITHLHAVGEAVAVGLYACSPMGAGFVCKFAWLQIGENNWFPPA